MPLSEDGGIVFDGSLDSQGEWWNDWDGYLASLDTTIYCNVVLNEVKHPALKEQGLTDTSIRSV